MKNLKFKILLKKKKHLKNIYFIVIFGATLQDDKTNLVNQQHILIK